MPQYKLTYADARGFAELSRLLFAQAGVDYEDVRQTKEEWDAIKESTPFGQRPILEVDGKMLCQSNTMARYIARQHGLAGKTPFEEAQADMVVDCTEDMIKPIMPFFFEKDEARKAELRKKYEEEQLPTTLLGLEKLLVSNNGGDYFVGNKVTWADITFAYRSTWTSYVGCSIDASKYPKLSALIKKVENLPNIKAWMEKRPKTEN